MSIDDYHLVQDFDPPIAVLSESIRRASCFSSEENMSVILYIKS